MKNNNFSKNKRILNNHFRITKNQELYKTKFGFLTKLLFLRKKIYLSNTSYSIKKTPWLVLIFSLAIFILTIIAFNKMQFSFIDEPMKYLKRTLSQLFAFKNSDPDLDASIFSTSFKTIISTIKISIFGTFVGLALSIPTAFLSARNLTKKWYINKPVRMIMALARTVPPIVLALILSLGFNGWTSASIVLIVMTWSGMNKILYEEIESIDMQTYYSMISMGYTRFSAFRETILKRIMNKFVEMGLYHFEISIRISAILGVVGGIAGIGGLIRQYSLDAKYWAFLAIPIFMIFSTIIIIEFTSSLVRVFILNKKTNPFDEEELSAFVDKKTYLLNTTSKKYDKLIVNTKFKVFKKFYEMKKNIILYFINKMKYKAIDRKRLNLMASKKIEQIKIKYQSKLDIFRKLITKKPKNKKHYEIAIEEYKKQENKEVARVTSLSQAKDRIFYVKQSKIPNIFTIIIFTLFLSMFIWSSASIEFGALENSVIEVWLEHIFNVDWDLVTSSSPITGVLPLLAEALLLALVATILGGIFAFVFGALASRNVSNYLCYPFQVLILLLRSFPPFLVAVVIAPMFKGNISIVGALALGLYSVGMLGKLIKSQFDQIDHGPVMAIKASGGTSFDAFRMGVLPQVTPNVISVIIYRWELNLKQTITVGIVGASQFGKRYYYTFSHNLYSSAFTYLWSIVLLVLILEFFSNIIRKYIVDGVLPAWINSIIKLMYRRQILLKKLFLKARGFDLNDITSASLEAYYQNEKLVMSSMNINLDQEVLEKVYQQNKQLHELKIRKFIKKDQAKTKIKDLKHDVKNNILKINQSVDWKTWQHHRRKLAEKIRLMKAKAVEEIIELKSKKKQAIDDFKSKMVKQPIVKKVVNYLTFNIFHNENHKEEIEGLKYLKKTNLIKYI